MADTFVQLFWHHTAGLIAPVRNKQFQQGVEAMAQVATGPLSRQWVEAADSGVGPIADLPLRLGRGT
jgi:hypothetical protein